MMWADRATSGGAVAASFLLYLPLMVVVTLLTGNAMQHPILFLEHLLGVSVMMGVSGVFAVCCQRCTDAGGHAGATVKALRAAVRSPNTALDSSAMLLRLP